MWGGSAFCRRYLKSNHSYLITFGTDAQMESRFGNPLNHEKFQMEVKFYNKCAPTQEEKACNSRTLWGLPRTDPAPTSSAVAPLRRHPDNSSPCILPELRFRCWNHHHVEEINDLIIRSLWTYGCLRTPDTALSHHHEPSGTRVWAEGGPYALGCPPSPGLRKCVSEAPWESGFVQ